ncbi:MAG: glycosyltransferase family 1 protein [Patescibacteria group bacterium]|jgi:glycosyltransferase involved in cell wall biosynthesis
MRIGVDIRGLLTGQRSGIEQYTLKVLEQLLALDQQNTYVLFYVAYRDLGSKLEYLLSEASFLKNSHVEIRSLKWINFPLLLHAIWKPFGWPWADKICGGLDVMWQPSPRLLPVSRQCRTVITFHDLVFALFPHFYTWKSRLWQWQMNYPYLARTADKMIAVSNSTKQDLVNLYHADPAKISVVYEGVDAIYFIPQPLEAITALRAQFNVPDKYLYYIGSLEPRKNVIAIVRGLHYIKQQEFANIKLVISGAKSWLSEAIFAEVEKLNLGQEVIFTGPVTEQKKITWLQNAAVFVFPTFYEGFGLPVLEAMAAGCPVITANVASLPEVTGAAALLIDPQRQSELDAALFKLLTEPDLAHQLSSAGRQQAHQFTWEKTAAAILNILTNGGE